MARCSSPEDYYSSGRNTELELCRLSDFDRGTQPQFSGKYLFGRRFEI